MFRWAQVVFKINNFSMPFDCVSELHLALPYIFTQGFSRHLDLLDLSSYLKIVSSKYCSRLVWWSSDFSSSPKVALPHMEMAVKKRNKLSSYVNQDRCSPSGKSLLRRCNLWKFPLTCFNHPWSLTCNRNITRYYRTLRRSGLILLSGKHRHFCLVLTISNRES